jgi:hypothetical protein
MQASEESAAYFERFLEFVVTHMPECFDAAEDELLDSYAGYSRESQDVLGKLVLR